MDDWYENLSRAFDVENSGPAAQGAGDPAPGGRGGAAVAEKAVPFAKAMMVSYPDGTKRHAIEQSMKAFVGDKLKIGTTEVNPLLVSSVNPRYTWIRNEETQTLNLLEAAPGPELYCDDYVRKINERRQGAVRAARVNPEAPISTTPINSVRTENFNTLAFWGDLVEVTFMAQAQVEQQINQDTEMLEMDSVMLSIRKAVNYDVINGIQQGSFAGTNIPQIGGLVERILTNTQACGNADMSDAFMRPNIRKIQNAIGSQLAKVLVCNMKQTEVIWGLDRGLWAGNDPMSYYNYNKVLGARLQAASVMVERIYEPGVGPPVGIIHDEDMGTNAIMLTLTRDFWPQLAYFRLMGKKGPWAFVRPVYDLKKSVFCMHGATMDDAGEESRVLFSQLLQ